MNTNSQSEFGKLWPSIITWALVLSPMVLLFDVIALALHVRLALGHWPKPMVESYDSPMFSFHSRAVVWVGLFAAYGAVPFWLVCLCFRYFRLGRRVHFMQLGAFVLSWIAAVAYFLLDPGSFINWFLD